MIHILTDSTADLGPDLLGQYQIEFIPLAVIHQGSSFRDQVDISLPQLFEAVSKTGELPKTSAPAVAEFTRFLDRPGEVIYIGLSSALSATQQNAQLALQALGRSDITVIDSLNLSSGIGLLVLAAADMRDRGCSAAEIAAGVRALLPKVRTSFIIDTLDYLHMGGRCSAMQNIVSSLLKIRPVIQVRPDGSLGIKEKIRGTRAKALASLVDDFRAHLDEIDLQRVFITHTGCDADAEQVKSELQRIAPAAEIHITYAGCVIASHCGPNTIGVLYLAR